MLVQGALSSMPPCAKLITGSLLPVSHCQLLSCTGTPCVSRPLSNAEREQQELEAAIALSLETAAVERAEHQAHGHLGTLPSCQDAEEASSPLRASPSSKRPLHAQFCSYDSAHPGFYGAYPHPERGKGLRRGGRRDTRLAIASGEGEAYDSNKEGESARRAESEEETDAAWVMTDMNKGEIGYGGSPRPPLTTGVMEPEEPETTVATPPGGKRARHGASSGVGDCRGWGGRAAAGAPSPELASAFDSPPSTAPQPIFHSAVIPSLRSFSVNQKARYCVSARVISLEITPTLPYLKYCISHHCQHQNEIFSFSVL